MVVQPLGSVIMPLSCVKDIKNPIKYVFSDVEWRYFGEILSLTSMRILLMYE